MIEGDAITEMRTAAASALATMELHPVLGNYNIGQLVFIIQTFMTEFHFIIIIFMILNDRNKISFFLLIPYTF